MNDLVTHVRLQARGLLSRADWVTSCCTLHLRSDLPSFDAKFMRAVLAKALLRFLSLLPLRVAHGLGALLGALFWWLPTGLRHVTTANVRRCFPELDINSQTALIRANLKETGKTLLEVGPLWFWEKQRLLDLFVQISGEEAVKKARSEQRGVIFAGLHLGSWELVGVHLSDRYAVTMMYRPPRLVELEPLIVASRERFGAHLVPTTAAGVRQLFQVLAQGGCVGILPDQDPGEGSGVFAPFFGQSAYSMTLLSRLARKTNAAVFFVYAQRLPRAAGYHLHFVPAHPDITNANTEIAARHLNAGVEACVRTLPEQYQWGYKRFKTRAAGDDEFYS